MKTLKSDKVVMFDVDDTLIMWDIPKGTPKKELIKVETEELCHDLLPHKQHVEDLKKHKIRNHYVVVWSAGGYLWAEAAVKALGLEDHVDIAMSKPSWIYDDLEPNKFLKNIYRRKDDDEIEDSRA